MERRREGRDELPLAPFPRPPREDFATPLVLGAILGVLAIVAGVMLQ